MLLSLVCEVGCHKGGLRMSAYVCVLRVEAETQTPNNINGMPQPPYT